MADRIPKGYVRAQLEALGELHGKDPSPITGQMQGGYKPRKGGPRRDTETQDQINIVKHCRAMGYPYDRIRSYPAEAVYRTGGKVGGLVNKLKAMGMAVGVPDLHLPLARGEYHGLYVELKTAEVRLDGKVDQKKGRVSDDQKVEIEQLRADGYAAVVCYGFHHTIDTLERYLKL